MGSAIVGLGPLNFVRIILRPLSAARDYLFAIPFVVVVLRGSDTLPVILSPPFLVFGYAFPVSLLVLLSRLDPMRQVVPRPLVLGILLGTITTVFAHACPDAQLALSHAPVQVAWRDIEFGKLLFYAALLTCLVTQVSKWDIVEVFFIDLHLVAAAALAPPAAPALCAA